MPWTRASGGTRPRPSGAGGPLVRLGQAEGRAITLRRPAEPAGQVPVARAEQLHRGGQQDGTDDRRVEQHGHRQADAHLLELDHGQGREGEENEDHDHGGGGDDPGGGLDANRHGLVSLAGAVVTLPDPEGPTFWAPYGSWRVPAR
jgi:hypothetical protein